MTRDPSPPRPPRGSLLLLALFLALCAGASPLAGQGLFLAGQSGWNSPSGGTWIWAGVSLPVGGISYQPSTGSSPYFPPVVHGLSSARPPIGVSCLDVLWDPWFRSWPACDPAQFGWIAVYRGIDQPRGARRYAMGSPWGVRRPWVGSHWAGGPRSAGRVATRWSWSVGTSPWAGLSGRTGFWDWGGWTTVYVVSPPVWVIQAPPQTVVHVVPVPSVGAGGWVSLPSPSGLPPRGPAAPPRQAVPRGSSPGAETPSAPLPPSSPNPIRSQPAAPSTTPAPTRDEGPLLGPGARESAGAPEGPAPLRPSASPQSPAPEARGASGTVPSTPRQTPASPPPAPSRGTPPPSEPSTVRQSADPAPAPRVASSPSEGAPPSATAAPIR